MPQWISDLSRTLDKALLILGSFNIDQPHLTADHLSRLSGMPISTIYRFLKDLVEIGYLTKKSPGQTYRLGPTLIRLARVADTALDVRTLAIPWMENLFEKTGETIFLTIRQGLSWICIESRMRQGAGIKFSVRPGETGPIYAGSPGKIFLAFMRESEMKSLLDEIRFVKLAPRTVTNRRALMKQLTEVRACGYRYSEEEFLPGAWGISAPLLNINGLAEATLSIAGVLQNNRKVSIDDLLKLLLEATHNISEKLGYDHMAKPGQFLRLDMN